MYRGLTLALCAVVLAAISVTNAFAVIDVALNLRYNDPADESEGGTWQLVANTDSPNGIAAVNALLQGVDNGRIVDGDAADDITVNSGIGAIDPVDAGGANEQPPYLDLGGDATDLIYGQDISDDASVVTGVGTGAGSAGDNGADQFGNSAFDNYALIASGSFSGARPSFNGADGNELDGTSSPFTASDDGATTSSVRGDSVGTDGLIVGDLDRSGDVDLFGDTLTALGNVGLSPAGWDDGDFNDSGDVDLFGDVLTALGNVGMAWTPPAAAAAGAVPEPTSVMLLMFGAGALGLARRR